MRLNYEEFDKKPLPLFYARLNDSDIIGWEPDIHPMIVTKWLEKHSTEWFYYEANEVWFPNETDREAFREWIEAQPFGKDYGEF